MIASVIFTNNVQTTDAELSVMKPIEIPAWIPKVCQPYWEEVTKYDWNATTSIKIMYAESGCNPKAPNLEDNHKVCKGSFGLMQISCDFGVLYDPVENIRVAYEEKYLVKNGKGEVVGTTWKPWSVCKSVNGKPPLVDCEY
jgi:hypothetical protein